MGKGVKKSHGYDIELFGLHVNASFLMCEANRRCLVQTEQGASKNNPLSLGHTEYLDQWNAWFKHHLHNRTHIV